MSVSNGTVLTSEIATIFSTLPVQFPNLSGNKNEKIKTQEFLGASSGVVTLVEKFGKVFAPVTIDMNGNIKKITDKFEQDKDRYEYIEDMILKSKENGDLVVVDALQWLRRALHFISRFFQLVIEDIDNNTNPQDLSPFIKSAYKETLERYHGWIGTQLFNILSRFSPSRHKLFYQFALERHHKDNHVLRDMRKYTQKLSATVLKLMEFYDEHDLENNDRV